MKLLLDQGLPRTATALLCEVGIDTAHVGDIGHASAEDATILELGRAEERIVVTLDADFHTLLALSGATAPSVIRIRIEGLRGDKLAELLQTVLKQCQDDFKTGAAVTVQENRIRVRHLPILSNEERGA